MPLNTWFFLAQGTDVLGRVQYDFLYTLEAGPPPPTLNEFNSRIPAPALGDFHVLTSAAVVQWTNDPHLDQCNCKMRYVRLYTDFVPYNEDMMISLALMEQDSKN